MAIRGNDWVSKTLPKFVKGCGATMFVSVLPCLTKLVGFNLETILQLTFES
jgi:hypothetical protein